MTQPDLLTWRDARRKADDGMSRSVAHADRVEPAWSERAILWVIIYARYHAEFMAEDARAHAHAGGLPNPPDRRAWGAVFKSAARAGHIVKIGYAPAKSSNLSPKVLWGRV